MMNRNTMFMKMEGTMVKVLYFSRNGNSKRIAEKIAQKSGAEMSVITDDKKWKGIFGFIKGGAYASSWKVTTPLLSPVVSWDQYDKIVIVSPVWANNVAPAVYSLLMKEKKIMNKLVLVINNSGSETDSAFSNIETKLGEIPHQFGITKRKNNEDSVINAIIKVLK